MAVGLQHARFTRFKGFLLSSEGSCLAVSLFVRIELLFLYQCV